MKRVVVIGGGTGVFTVLTGLKDYPYHMSAIVSMADDGGSTGSLREEFGILPPGDIRRALVALAASDNKIVSELFNYRFAQDSSLHGHSLGNLLLTALEKITGSFDKGLKEAVKILNIKGDVIPVTLTKTKLLAKLENGTEIVGESNIDIPKHDGNLKITNVFLSPNATATKDALAAIASADTIILGPGDLYTSIIPNLLVKGITSAIKKSKAQKIYIVNIMTKYGETNSFTAKDFVMELEQYLGKNVLDFIVVNTEKLYGEILERYKEEKTDFVMFSKKMFSNEKYAVVEGKFLRRGKFLRHNPKKLAAKLAAIIEEIV